MPARLRPLIALYGLLLAGCLPLGPWEKGTSPEDTAGRIVVSPQDLDFGTTDTPRSLSFSVYNLTDASVLLSGHNEPIGTAGFSVAAEPVIEIFPGDTLEIPVTFTPPADGAMRAELLLLPIQETVRMTADSVAPELTIGDITLEPTVTGCSHTGFLPLTNLGRIPLHISAASFTSDEYTLTVLPQEIAAGTTEVLEFSFAPAGSGARGAYLQLSTDDPATPLASVPISGLGYEGERLEEHFFYYPTNPTDILVVVAADSTSEASTDATQSYIEALREDNIDYHITAVSGGGPCPVGAPAWSDRTDTSLQGAGVLSRAFRAGPGPYDGGLLALAADAVDQSGSGGCLEGFRREDADFELLLISGQEGGFSTYDLERLGLISDHVRISGLLPLSGCRSNSYADAVSETGGVLQDWCGDWEEAMLALAGMPTGDSDVEFFLSEAPVSSTIEVMADGVSISGWSYDTAQNAVLIYPLPLGTDVTVRYVSAVACE